MHRIKELAPKSRKRPPLGHALSHDHTITQYTIDPIFYVCSEATISALPSKGYDVLLTFRDYPKWNSFVNSVQNLPASAQTAADVIVGMQMTIQTSGLIDGINTTSGEAITALVPATHEDIDSPSVDSFVYMAWKFNPGLGTFGQQPLQAEHISLFKYLGNGQSLYVSWETYYGLLGGLVLPLRANLQKEFEKQGQDLAAWIQSGCGGNCGEF